jgi:hypothetical protein
MGSVSVNMAFHLRDCPAQVASPRIRRDATCLVADIVHSSGEVTDSRLPAYTAYSLTPNSEKYALGWTA